MTMEVFNCYARFIWDKQLGFMSLLLSVQHEILFRGGVGPRIFE